MPNTDEHLETRLHHKFSDGRLLDRALTHSSALPEIRATREPNDVEAGDNEQLEFLGDAVLNLLASEYLLKKFPDWSEGQLSKSRARLVNAHSLEQAARRLDLGGHLRIGRGEEKTGGREKPTLLADAYEAVVAAIYLDGGLPAAREMLRVSLFEHALERGEQLFEADRKSALQEFLQGRGNSPAEYRVAAESGPDHRKMFRIEVWVGGACLAVGEGTTKKEAEQRGAREALVRLETSSLETSGSRKRSDAS